MKVDELGGHFDIEEYQIQSGGDVQLRLVNDTLVVRLPYIFRSTNDVGMERELMVDAVMLPQQAAAAKAFILAIVQQTNTAILEKYGWTYRKRDDQ